MLKPHLILGLSLPLVWRLRYLGDWTRSCRRGWAAACSGQGIAPPASHREWRSGKAASHPAYRHPHPVACRRWPGAELWSWWV